jgi:hypothetical protein
VADKINDYVIIASTNVGSVVFALGCVATSYTYSLSGKKRPKAHLFRCCSFSPKGRAFRGPLIKQAEPYGTWQGRGGEYYWGHYFANKKQALADYNRRIANEKSNRER